MYRIRENTELILDDLIWPLARPDLEKNQATKREVFSYTSSLFDPLGLWLPWTLRHRVLLQASWNAQLGWDDYFSPELLLY